MKRFILVSFIFIFLLSTAYSMDVTHPKLRKGSDLDKYAHDLIVMLLEKSGVEANMISRNTNANQSRKVSDMEKGKLDVDWYGLDKDLEERLIPIRFPIFMSCPG